MAGSFSETATCFHFPNSIRIHSNKEDWCSEWTLSLEIKPCNLGTKCFSFLIFFFVVISIKVNTETKTLVPILGIKDHKEEQCRETMTSTAILIPDA